MQQIQQLCCCLCGQGRDLTSHMSSVHPCAGVYFPTCIAVRLLSYVQAQVNARQVLQGKRSVFHQQALICGSQERSVSSNSRIKHTVALPAGIPLCARLHVRNQTRVGQGIQRRLTIAGGERLPVVVRHIRKTEEQHQMEASKACKRTQICHTGARGPKPCFYPKYGRRSSLSHMQKMGQSIRRHHTEASQADLQESATPKRGSGTDRGPKMRPE